MSGYIVGSVGWLVRFWQSNGLEVAIIFISFGFLEETFYNRTTSPETKDTISQFRGYQVDYIILLV